MDQDTGGSNNTARVFHQAAGSLSAESLEVRWRTESAGRHWRTASSCGGSLDVHRESFPAFEDRDSSLDASLEAYRLGLGYSWPRTELMLTATYDREHLPFVSLAVLGTETVAFDAGSIRTRSSRRSSGTWPFGTPSRRRSGRGCRSVAWGDETVRLTDSAGVLPDRTLDVARRARWAAASRVPWFPEPTLFIGADFSIGAPQPAAPGFE